VPAIEIYSYGIGLFFGFCGTAIIDWIILGYRPKRATEGDYAAGFEAGYRAIRVLPLHCQRLPVQLGTRDDIPPFLMGVRAGLEKAGAKID